MIAKDVNDRTAAGTITRANQSVSRAAVERRPSLLWVQTEDLTQILDSATWLKTADELRALGWDVFLVQPGPAGSEPALRDGLLYVPKPATYFLGQRAFHRNVLKWLDAHGGVDVVMFHPLSALWLSSARRARGGKRPLLLMDIRTLFMRAAAPRPRDRFRAFYYEHINGLAQRWLDGYLAITPHMATASGISQERLLGVWPSGVDAGIFAPAAAARQWPAPGEPIRLVYIGSLHVERNLLGLSRAVVAANRAGMNFQLLMVGRGSQQEELAAFARQSGGAVEVRPAVPHSEVWKVLAETHVGVLPFPDELKFRVSSPIKLFEYLAAGMPILATRVVCHTDIVGNDAYAFLAASGEQDALVAALRELWAARARLPELGRQAMATTPQWTWQASAAKLDVALRRALAERVAVTR